MGAKKEFCYAVKTTDTQAQEEDATTEKVSMKERPSEGNRSIDRAEGSISPSRLVGFRFPFLKFYDSLR